MIDNLITIFYKSAAFDEDLKPLKSFAKRVKYCEEHYKIIASGSARVIYDMGDGTVLKLAKNPKGIAQNTTENDHGLNNWYGEIVAKVLKADDDNSWIISQKADKITPTEFKNIIGVSFKDFAEYLRCTFYFLPKPENLENLGENEFIERVISLVADFDLQIGDLMRISSFGKVNNKVVITDYGLTKSIYVEYYQ